MRHILNRLDILINRYADDIANILFLVSGLLCLAVFAINAAELVKLCL